ncbi:hypothetical protein CDD81_3664 [Ophiocordyceps australis]|uniref:Magnesium transporter n=1 Tax=Ophiocordyceps australis TaxID=1399860 RepID=A0A2C5XE07_9HYPO|nr:hypothetical protein CDD81_3664 [Ophiocordyceps australis]
MTWLSRSVTTAGLMLLAHSCYSAQEHAALSSTLAARSGPLTATVSGPVADGQASAALPIDIRIEAVVATLVLCLGLVLGSQKLRPVEWRVWAGKLEREGEGGIEAAEGECHGNPFAALESRPGFVDIRRQRRDFVEWAKGGRT